MENSNKSQALILISKLFNEQRISEEHRDSLKEMIFNDDTTLLSFFEHYEDEKDQGDAIVRYVSGGVLEANRPMGLAQPKDADDLDQLSSPTDSALDMKKRKRMNQQAAADRAKH